VKQVGFKPGEKERESWMSKKSAEMFHWPYIVRKTDRQTHKHR